MKVPTLIYAFTLAGTCACRPIAEVNTRMPLVSEHQTTQRVPAALPTNSAGEIVFPHGMNGHTIHPIPTAATSLPKPVSTVHEAHENGSSAPGDVLEGRAVAIAPFPPLHGAKNSTVDVPDHGHLPPYTHHHPRDDGTLEAVNHRHLPPWKYHHDPHQNESAEVVVDHRRLPSWILHRPTTTMAKITSSAVTPTSSLKATTTTPMLAAA